MEPCRHCKKPLTISPKQRARIRAFKTEFPFIPQRALAELFDVTAVRISEIVRGIKSKGGL